MESETLMAVEPGPHLGMLVSGVVVKDDVNGLVGRHLGVDGVEKADELLVAVALHVPADDGSVEHMEGGKQCGRAVSLVDAMDALRGMPPWARQQPTDR